MTIKKANAHSVQVGYCVSCMGELTLYVEHWHGAADPSSTTMTIQLNINGVITTQTGSPIENIQDTPFSELPGCTNPINIFATCGGGEANTYNDWVVFKFPNLPTGVPVYITINSGNTVFTEDGCNMYPATSPQIIVPPIVNPPPVADSSHSICVGESTNINLTNYFGPFQWQSAPSETGPWTDIPGATTTPLNTGFITETTYYRAISPGTCESNAVEIIVNPAVVPTSGLGPGTGTGAGNDTTSCPSNTPVPIGTPTTTGYTYSWLPTAGLSSTTISNPTASISTPNTTTTYTLTTTTSFGCTSIDSVTVTVKEIPLSNAGADITTCATIVPDTIGTTSTLGYTYSWSPSTNLSSNTVANPIVDVENPDTTTYIVTTTLDGCVSSDTVVVVVNPMPKADFNFQDVCHQQAMSFVDTSIINGDLIASWTWDFGDGSTPSNTQSPSHNYTNPGEYVVNLIVETTSGCIDSITKTVEVHPNPVAQFTYENMCDGVAIPLVDYSTIDSPDIIQNWIWDFGDTTAVFSGQTIGGGHLYGAPGAYDVKLKTVSDFGCVDSIIKTVVVNPNPVVAFVADDTANCEPLCLTFNNQSTILTGTNASWLIDYGDGSDPSTDNLTHCYYNPSPVLPQSYTPILLVVSDSGCVSTLSKPNYITVFPNPIANFTIEPQTTSIVSPVVDINNLSSGSDTWDWDFGDLQSSILESPESHTYPDTGTYLITLITATQYGCYDTAYQTVVVEPETVFYVPNVFSPNGDGINDTFYGKGLFVTEYEMRIFDRWGDEIFYTNNIEIPWDGRSNYGKEVAQQDVYIYQITLKDINRKKRDYTGIVTLVR
ncbi:MAG: PKD domain-containing protein [Bacteroidia bacterium]